MRLSSPNRRLPRSGLALCLLAPLFAAPSALGQVSAGVEKPQPNVLLLVDTSGSMEFQANGTFPTCNPGSPALTNGKSRWIDLVEVLTGEFEQYSCWAQDRNSAGFRSEFSLGGNLPYDVGYVNPYHRPLSNSCLYGPGVLPSSTNPYAFPTRGVNTFTFSGGNVIRPGDLTTHTGCAGFSQKPDGLLDVYKDQIRFGLMTFDTHVNAGTGLSGTNAHHPSGIAGTWSYYVGSPITGHPEFCTFEMDQEVGARNAAAPPWEGRMVAFGPPTTTDNTQRNTWIQEVLLATRPYGATPIAGLLDDARNFLWNDASPDPVTGSGAFGPRSDPNWLVPNCRKTIAILLTDGEPNLDLRPFCEGPGDPPTGRAGRCPYERPEEIVSALRLDPPTPSQSVETYVVAFALGRVTPAGGSEIACSELTDEQCSSPANASNKALQACCTLNKIAAAGGLDENGQPRRAFFAENRDELRSIFTEILDDVVQLTTRTIPVFAGAGGDSQSAGFKFFSAFDPRPDPSTASLWKGVLERRRFVCNEDLEPIEQYDPASGDDFGANLAAASLTPRSFRTVIADGNSSDTIRPRVTDTGDGLELSSGTSVSGTASTIAAQIPPAKMQITASDCEGADGASAEACRNAIVGHAVGLPGTFNRCPSADNCNLLGGIYHSVPQIVPGRPADFLRDESYQAFVERMATDQRPTVLYTSSVDGFLHAFKVAPFPGVTTGAVDSQANNELWAFLPPAVLPTMQAQYPATPAILLDGLPVIKDVVARVEGGNETFERKQADAETGAGDWRTVLVQGFGDGQVQGGYFALDVTRPAIDGPKFLWQLTRTSTGQRLFGNGGTPLITTLFVESLDGPREVAVAVLPGGDAAPIAGTDSGIGTVMDTEPSSFGSNRETRLYSGAEAARSLTIVRLDTGKVLRSFRPAGGAATFDASVVTETVIPSPIVGQPRAFPADAGAVADRIFVGDRDGRLWRLDVSSTDPEDWTMKVFFDAFWDGDPDDGQPVEVPPMLSVNDEGNITIAFATGDQRAVGGASTLQNRVVSLTEKIKDGEFVAHVNWVQTLTNAERVTGPMVLFNRGLYYAASRPPSTTASACDVGGAKVFGAHFELNRSQQDTSSPTDDPASGPGVAPDVSELLIEQRSDGMIFGVSLEAEPSCASDPEEVTGDESFGYSAVSTSQSVKAGRFFLAYQVNGASSSARGVADAQILLSTPRVPVTFESWALIYE